LKVQALRPAYVEFIPNSLEGGVLYVSHKYKTASHLCCCGCGNKIVTPLRETEFSLTEREGKVSLSPSIGNWNHPCQSHYWIRGNQVVWAEPMSKEEIRKGRAYDDTLKDDYFGKAAWPWWRRALGRIERFVKEQFGQ
jgi:hypothetical protein